ncbi:MAG: DUF1456 family protein [Polyangiaceae bacterium]|nr:DUF1456 family protein [Polyangiaceae bacterium]
MTNNDVLRSLRYALNVGEARLIEIFRLAGLEVSPEDVAAFLKREEEEGYAPCPHEVMAHFLNGLVIFKRGKDPARPPQPLEVPVTNNAVLKKIRVAFSLKDTDIIALIEAAGLTVTKAELGAFFRLSSHRNYRECGDQFLRYVLKGVAQRAG